MVFFGLSFWSLVSVANERVEILKKDFPQCIARFQQQALDSGVSEHTSQNIVANLKPIEKLLQYDSNQPEFVQTFTGYFSKRVNDWRIDKGREKLKLHKEFLAKLTQQYGIPGQYLIAFWGLETNFGAYKGKIPTLSALATLACDKRRSEYFSGELVQALLLLER
jgi:membrane-bound lytic murein transglycosylase B